MSEIYGKEYFMPGPRRHGTMAHPIVPTKKLTDEELKKLTENLFPPPDLEDRVREVYAETAQKRWNEFAHGETRVVDPTSGGQKGTKAQRMGLLPWDSLMKVSEHYAAGAEKYEDRNWERGYAWHLTFDALQRHLAAWWQGEDLDDEGLEHLNAVVFHALALRTFTLRGIGTDDRPGR